MGSVASVIDGGFKGFSDSDEEEEKEKLNYKSFTPKPIVHKMDSIDAVLKPPEEEAKHQEVKTA